jgi:hypothetical protein
LVDTLTDKAAYVGDIGPQKGYLQGLGLVSIPPYQEGEIRIVLVTSLNLPADLVELWLQVALRGELGPDGSFVKWKEPMWEQKRQELAARPAPYPDFPFPGHVATDGLHWLRREFEEATDEADKLRLARDLLRRAEAAGDRTEAVRWRAEVAKRTPEVAPPPRPGKP